MIELHNRPFWVDAVMGRYSLSLFMSMVLELIFSFICLIKFIYVLLTNKRQRDDM